MAAHDVRREQHIAAFDQVEHQMRLALLFEAPAVRR